MKKLTTLQIIKRRNLSAEDDISFTKILSGNFPNTYVFTKSIGEGELNKRAKDLPFSIFRFPISDLIPCIGTNHQ
ncbi:uncharacterized protein LOC117167516 [Belonocnema kinseyi]|uniref:uncharacterized protein LOC117167516 n=1 Tax=Belonocnema kinseyi TaxID=2817044 RepID=UPI00143E0C50|nr:uncharacterized protein LOC117167516 [Belonocnema kinseyi]